MPFTVLLVDDDAAVLSTLKSVLETRNFEISTSSSAAAAVEALDRSSFDLVLTDMRMETSTSGFEVVCHAKSQPNRPAVVILSAFPIPATEWREAGADAMFVKGGGIFRILDDIEQLLQARAKSIPQ